MKISSKDSTTWIIGASTGIGAELANSLVKNGETVILSSRNEEALRKLQKTMSEGFSGNALVEPLDISDSQQILSSVDRLFLKHRKIHRVIIMAGLYDPGPILEATPSKTENIIKTNLVGPANLVHAVLPKLKNQRNYPQLVICASLVGVIGLPNGQPYSCTKAALINFTESLYVEEGNWLDVKLINPGFVKTRLTDLNNFKMPALISAEKAANIINRGLNKKAFEIHFPKKISLLVKLLSILPRESVLRLIRYLKKR